MDNKNVSKSVAQEMVAYYTVRITVHFRRIRTDLDKLAKYASIIYGTPLRAYVNADSSIGFHCTDPSSPKYTDKDLTLDDIL